MEVLAVFVATLEAGGHIKLELLGVGAVAGAGAAGQVNLNSLLGVTD